MFGNRSTMVEFCLTIALSLTLFIVVSGGYTVYPAEARKGVSVEAVEKGGVKIWTERGCGTVYHLEDLLNIRVKSRRSGYLTIFDLMPNGEVQVLFPNKFDQDNYIQSGKVYEIPTVKDTFQLRISPPRGRDQFLAVVTENKKKLVREDFSYYAEKFPKLRDSKGEVLQQVKKGVEVIPDEVWWAADSCEIYVGTSSKPYEPEDDEDAPSEEHQQEPLEGRALIVGIEAYSGEKFNHMGRVYQFPDLKYSLNDAKEMKNTLTGVINEVKLLTNQNATYDTIKKTVKDWLGAAGPDELVLLYFSGHGAYQMDMNGDEDDARDEVLVPYDYASTEKFIVDDEINDWLNSLSAKDGVYIADSCYAGTSSKAVRTFTTSASTKSAKGQVLEDSIGRDLIGDGDLTTKGADKRFLALEASKPSQSAIEDKDLENGVFTHYLIKGLKGEADQNEDGKISVQELFEFSQKGVREYTKNKQDPMCSGCSGEELILAFVR